MGRGPTRSTSCAPRLPSHLSSTPDSSTMRPPSRSQVQRSGAQQGPDPPPPHRPALTAEESPVLHRSPQSSVPPRAPLALTGPLGVQVIAHPPWWAADCVSEASTPVAALRDHDRDLQVQSQGLRSTSGLLPAPGPLLTGRTPLPSSVCSSAVRTQWSCCHHGSHTLVPDLHRSPGTYSE